MVVPNLLTLPLEIRQQIYRILYPPMCARMVLTSPNFHRPSPSLAGLAFVNRLLYNEICDITLEDTTFFIPLSSFQEEGSRSIIDSPYLGQLKKVTIMLDSCIINQVSSEQEQEMLGLISFLDALSTAKEKAHSTEIREKWLRKLLISDEIFDYFDSSWKYPYENRKLTERLRLLVMSLQQSCRERCEFVEVRDLWMIQAEMS